MGEIGRMSAQPLGGVAKLERLAVGAKSEKTFLSCELIVLPLYLRANRNKEIKLK